MGGENIQKEIKDLNQKFLTIKNKGWIKTLRNNASGVGYTFEKLIGKEEENFPIADYKNIEIKTSRKTSWGKIHLFHATPDGDYLFPIKSILEILGYPDKDYPEYKVFNVSTTALDYTKIGYNKKLKIKVDQNEEKIRLIAKNNNNESYNLYISWSFDMLKKRIALKLKNLALVKAYSKKIDGVEYFKYDKIKFYKLKSFNTFIELIEKGKISITFTIGMYKNGKRFGQIHDRGTIFTINEKNISYLYDEIDNI